MTITKTSLYSRKTGELITANYEPSKEAIEKVAQVALALAMTEIENNAAVIIDRVTVK